MLMLSRDYLTGLFLLGVVFPLVKADIEFVADGVEYVLDVSILHLVINIINMNKTKLEDHLASLGSR